MTFLIMLAVSITLGWYAQTKKGRTGAKWAAGSLSLMGVAWFFLFFCISLAKPGFFDVDANLYGLAIMVVGGIGLLLGLAVASLPKKDNPERPAA